MNERDIEALLAKAIEGAEADETLAHYAERRELVVRYAENVVIQPSALETAQLSVTASFGRQSGTAATGDLSPEGLRTCRKRAEAIARSAPADPEHMPLLGPQKYMETHGYSEATAALDPQDCVGIAAQAIAAAREKSLALSGSFSASAGAAAMANSKGLFGSHRRTHARLLATGFAGSAAGWAQQVETDIRRIDPRRAAQRAMQKALACADPIAVAPGRYTVVLEPAAADDFFVPLFWGMNARAADEGRSPLSGKLGRQIGLPIVSMATDPSDPQCPGAPFVEGGLAQKRVEWIKDGRLLHLVANRYWAQKTGREPTGQPVNILMSGGADDVEGLVRRVERGLLVTRFFYIRRVDPMTLLNTGMTRDGLFLIEAGRLSRGVKNMRWNDSPLDALWRIEALGRPERSGPALMPAVLARDFNFSSATEF